jgi:hypothetical protein
MIKMMIGVNGNSSVRKNEGKGRKTGEKSSASGRRTVKSGKRTGQRSNERVTKN